MLIPVDRPLIDGRNIREAATQTVSASFVATHNQRSVLLLTADSADRSSGAPHIQAGVRIGQELTIIVTDDANKITLIDGGGTGTQFGGNWAVADNYGIGAWLKVVWDGTRWWEIGRGGNSELSAYGLCSHAEGSFTTAGGDDAHAEGRSTVATGGRAHAEGSSTTASALRAHAEGYYCTAEATQAHAGGRYSKASLYAEYARSCGRFAATGDAQKSEVQLRKATTDATLTELFIDGTSSRLTILDEYTYACKVTVVGRQDTGADHFMGTYHVLIERTGGTVALVGAVGIIYENNAGGLGAGGGLPVAITADDTNKSLKISVEGLAAHNIRWVADVEMVRVGYAD